MNQTEIGCVAQWLRHLLYIRTVYLEQNVLIWLLVFIAEDRRFEPCRDHLLCFFSHFAFSLIFLFLPFCFFSHFTFLSGFFSFFLFPFSFFFLTFIHQFGFWLSTLHRYLPGLSSEIQ